MSPTSVNPSHRPVLEHREVIAWRCLMLVLFVGFQLAAAYVLYVFFSGDNALHKVASVVGLCGFDCALAYTGLAIWKQLGGPV